MTMKELFNFNLLHYLILLRNANTSFSRSRSTFFPDSRCYSLLAHVVFFETAMYIVAIDVAQSSVLDCELALAWKKIIIHKSQKDFEKEIWMKVRI